MCSVEDTRVSPGGGEALGAVTARESRPHPPIAGVGGWTMPPRAAGNSAQGHLECKKKQQKQQQELGKEVNPAVPLAHRPPCCLAAPAVPGRSSSGGPTTDPLRPQPTERPVLSGRKEAGHKPEGVGCSRNERSTIDFKMGRGGRAGERGGGFNNIDPSRPPATRRLLGVCGCVLRAWCVFSSFIDVAACGSIDRNARRRGVDSPS